MITILFDDGWTDIMTGFNRIISIVEGGFKESFSRNDAAKYYTIAYNMCVQKPPYNYSEELYNNYISTMHTYCSSILPQITCKNGDALLTQLRTTWNNYSYITKYLTKVIFSYLDRYYIIKNNIPDTGDIGLISFNDEIFVHIKDTICNVILEHTEKERDCNIVDKDLLKECIYIYITLGTIYRSKNKKYMHSKCLSIYEVSFESKFLLNIAKYYKQKVLEWMVIDTLPEYMIKVEDILNKEENCSYIYPSTIPKLVHVCEHELLEVHIYQLLNKENSGCISLLMNKHNEHLTRMYKLFQRVPNGLETIASIIKEHIIKVGKNIVLTCGDGKGLIQSLITIHKEYLGLLHECLFDDIIFQRTIKDAFQVFVNMHVSINNKTVQMAELMSAFSDDLMKNTNKLSDTELEQSVSDLIDLFVHLIEKDIFAQFYRIQLSRRLLLLPTLLDDLERSMIHKLKLSCGSQFVVKMEGMIQDLSKAVDMHSDWVQYTSQNKQLIDLRVRVLTTGYWPSLKIDDFVVPEALISSMEQYIHYYTHTSKHKMLRWVHSLGTNTLIMNHTIKGKTKKTTLNVSTIQAAILLLFNDKDVLTLKEISNTLGLQVPYLRKYIHSLGCHKNLILLGPNDTKPSELTEDSEFSYNPKFTSKKAKITMPLLMMTLSDSDKVDISENVQADRKSSIEAAIVRIMKSRQKVSHNDLIIDVSNQLMQFFKPDLKFIKKRIEDLIEREYIERDEEINGYSYMA